MRDNSKKSGRAVHRAMCGLVTATVLVVTSVLAAAERTQAQEVCGDLTNAFGPFDYTDPQNRVQQEGRGEAPLSLVERGHFSPEVENLIRGVSSTVVADLDYTLRAFPNHHRALYAMSKYSLTKGGQGAQLGTYTLECWFDRATRFAPRDGVVPAVYGVYLAKKGDRKGALVQYKRAIELVPDFAEAHYNLGLLYIDLKQYDLANAEAATAYKLGFPLPGLRKRLQDLGAWNPAAAE